MYETDERLTIAAPMPGLEPEDIEVEVTPDDRLILHGRVRGFLKGVKTLVLDEWTVGGYHRELKLTSPVDASLANVTYGNGVLVVVLPKANETRPARLRMQEIAPDTGQRVGNAGHPPHPVTTEEHARAIEREEEQHGGPAGHPIFGLDDQARSGIADDQTQRVRACLDGHSASATGADTDRFYAAYAGGLQCAVSICERLLGSRYVASVRIAWHALLSARNRMRGFTVRGFGVGARLVLARPPRYTARFRQCACVGSKGEGVVDAEHSAAVWGVESHQNPALKNPALTPADPAWRAAVADMAEYARGRASAGCADGSGGEHRVGYPRFSRYGRPLGARRSHVVSRLSHERRRPPRLLAVAPRVDAGGERR